MTIHYDTDGNSDDDDSRNRMSGMGEHTAKHVTMKTEHKSRAQAETRIEKR